MNHWTGYEQYDSLPDRPVEDRWIDYALILAAFVMLVVFGIWQS